MKTHLVSGGCGFVGRNVVKRILQKTEDRVVVVDDLSTGLHPSDWLENVTSLKNNDLEVLEDERLLFWQGDFRNFLRNLLANPNYLNENYGLSIQNFSDVHHFAAIVGGRAKIEGDPMAVGIDLSIDAEFFYWVCQHKPERILYPSSSAAYPVNLQAETQSIALQEKEIDFESAALGKPDMTYGWSKLTAARAAIAGIG